jgi:hypothetical protein
MRARPKEQNMKKADTHYLLGAAVALATVLFLVLGIGALGIIGAGGRPDRWYVGVLAVGAIGTVLARLRPRGMAWTLVAMAVAQVVAPVVAYATGQAEGASVVDVVGLTVMYAGLFCFSAWFFWRSAESRSATGLPAAS